MNLEDLMSECESTAAQYANILLTSLLTDNPKDAEVMQESLEDLKNLLTKQVKLYKIARNKQQES